MTDPTTSTEPQAGVAPDAQESATLTDPATDPATTPDPATPEPPDGGEAALRHEAAGWRRRLRDTERERDALRARVDDHDRREVERIASGQLADASDLWTVASLDELRDEAGAVDVERVREQVADVVKRKPHWRRAAEPPVDLHAGARATVPAPPSFGEAAKRALR